MRLDRNGGDGRGKYGLLKLRRLAEVIAAGGDEAARVDAAVALLERAGLIEYADKPETEFFAIKLRDRFAASALFGYANAAHVTDPEYAEDVHRMARRSGPAHPLCKTPD